MWNSESKITNDSKRNTFFFLSFFIHYFKQGDEWCLVDIIRPVTLDNVIAEEQLLNMWRILNNVKKKR